MMRTYRFAPSPNGAMHLGHALSALLNFDLARAYGGRLLVRIEDIDRARCRPELEAAIFEDLRWLGLAWEEPVWRQSERGGAYTEAIDRLDAMGLLYRCFATRSEIGAAVGGRADHPRDPDDGSVYPGLWRGADPGEVTRRVARGAPYALRLDMARAVETVRRLRADMLDFEEADQEGVSRRVAAEPEAYGDVVLAPKNMMVSYHLAVVVDDAAQGVTHVARGRDLYHQTAIHRLLQVLLGLPAPLYRHHALVLGPDGTKLAKSRRDESLAAMRAAGATADDIRRMAYSLAGERRGV